MSPCKDEGSSYPILKRLGDFLVKILDFQLILFSFPSPQVPSPPTKVSQNLNTLVVIRLDFNVTPAGDNDIQSYSMSCNLLRNKREGLTEVD